MRIVPTTSNAAAPCAGRSRKPALSRAIISPMKRLILILLLALVPLQFAWAAAGAYCQHEQGSSSFHFGHHAHTHQTKNDSPDSKTKQVKAHPDCGSCHAPANVIWMSAPSIALVFSPPEHHRPVTLLYSSFIPNGPRRPDRLPGT